MPFATAKPRFRLFTSVAVARGGEVDLRTKRRETAFGETNRKQLTRVVVMIFEAFNDPLIECDQDNAFVTSLSTKVKTS